MEPASGHCTSALTRAINVTFDLGKLHFSFASGPVEDQCDLGKFVFHGLVAQLKINVTFALGKFVIVMG